MDQEYQYLDLGFTFTVSALGEIVTDPGFKPGEWFVRHRDEQGFFISPLEMELSYHAGNDNIWETPTMAVFNDTQTVVLLFKLEAIQLEKMMCLIHSSAAEEYLKIVDK